MYGEKDLIRVQGNGHTFLANRLNLQNSMYKIDWINDLECNNMSAISGQ